MDAKSNEELVAQLASAVELTTGMLKRMLSHHSVQREELETFREDFKRLRDRISRIVQVLHEGNGERPLLTRVAILEEKVEGIEKDIETMLEAKRSAQVTKNIRVRGRWELLVAVISAIAAISVGLLSLLK